ncbi:hypothetical protein MTO96_049516 [Rhipicephalus appendiculatus]
MTDSSAVHNSREGRDGRTNGKVWGISRNHSSQTPFNGEPNVNFAARKERDKLCGLTIDDVRFEASNREESNIETYSRQQQLRSPGPLNATLRLQLAHCSTAARKWAGYDDDNSTSARRPTVRTGQSSSALQIEKENRERAHTRVRTHARTCASACCIAFQFRVEISVSSAASVRVLAFKRAALLPSQRVVRSACHDLNCPTTYFSE